MSRVSPWGIWSQQKPTFPAGIVINAARASPRCAGTSKSWASIPMAPLRSVALPEVDVWKNDPTIPLEFTAIQEPLGNAIDTVLVEDVAGKTVLVTGCGPIGLLAIGIARASGATCILASEVSPLRRQLAEHMGATWVLNPLEMDIVEAVRAQTNGDGVDVLLEMSGNVTALRQGLQALTQGGRVSLLGLFEGPVPLDLNTQIILKDVRLYGITGRHIFATWYKAALFTVRPA